EARRLFEHLPAISLKAAATGSKIMEIITLLEDAMNIFESVFRKGIKEDKRSLGYQHAETARELLLEAEGLLKASQDLYSRWWRNRLRLHATPSHTYSGRTIYTQSVVEELAGDGGMLVEAGVGDGDAPTFRELQRSIGDKARVKAIEFNPANIPEELRDDIVPDNILALRRNGEASKIIGEAKVIRISNLAEIYFGEEERARLIKVFDRLMPEASYLLISSNIPGDEMFEDEEGYLYQKIDGRLRLEYFISSHTDEMMPKGSIDIGMMKAVPISSEFLRVPEGLWPPWQDRSGLGRLPPMGGGQDYGTVRSLAMTKSVPELVEVARGMVHDGLEGQIGIIRETLSERDMDMLGEFERLFAGGHPGAITFVSPPKTGHGNPITVNVMNEEGEGFDDIFVIPGNASPVLGAEDHRLARSDLDVCVAISAYNQNTVKRFMVHILPSGHLDGKYFWISNIDDPSTDLEEAKKRYMAALFSKIDLSAEGPLSGWRFVVSKGPGILTADPSRVISSEDVKKYLIEQKMIGADNIGLDMYNPPGVAIKRVVLNKDGIVSVFCRFSDGAAFNRYVFDLTGGSISPAPPASSSRNPSADSSPKAKDRGSRVNPMHSGTEEDPNVIIFESSGLSLSDVRGLGISEEVIPEADMIGFNTALRDRSLWSTEIDMDGKEKIVGLIVELIGNAQYAVGFQNEKQARARLSYHPGPKILELNIAQDVLQEADLLKLKNNHAKYIERGLVYFSTEYATRSRDKSLVTNYGSGLEIFAQVALKNGAVLEYVPGGKGMRTRLYVRLEALPGPEDDFVVEWQSSGKVRRNADILPVATSDVSYAPGRIETEQPIDTRQIVTEATKDGARVFLRDKPPVAEMRSRAPREGIHQWKKINDERKLLRDAAINIAGHPVNMPIDISLIPREGDGLTPEEAAGQLDDNMETLTRLMAWHNAFGLDVHYAFTGGDEKYAEEALRLVRAKLDRIASMPGVKLDVDAMLELSKEPGAIEVPLIDMEKLKAMGDMPERTFPVALVRGTGAVLPNYTSAAAIGLSIAGLKFASEKETEAEYKRKAKEAFGTIERIYKRWGVDTKELSLESLDMLVKFSAKSRLELIINLNLALPPILKAAIEKLHEVHHALQLLLQSA
nr:hypothetical protein [Candidatus Omnitrophota bacterium]